MNWDWLIARRGISKAEPKQPEAENLQEPIHVSIMMFSRSVGDGYIDDKGIWYATRLQAEKATATRHMENGAMIYSSYLSIGTDEFINFLKKPETIQAMAILSRT